jgi:hypothetical protein
MTCSVPDDRGSPLASEDQQQLCSGGSKHFSEPIKDELHGPGYYLFGSQADPGYAEQMRTTNGREDEDPQRQDPPTFGSS